MAGNTTNKKPNYGTSREYKEYDELPSVIKKAFQNAPADFSATFISNSKTAQKMRKALTDEEYADWLSEQFIDSYRNEILQSAY